MLLNIIKNRQGITLIEVLVTISIIVTVLSLYTINYQAASKRSQVILSAQKVVSDLRLAQSYAASAKRFNENVESNIWGVYFDTDNPSQYILFNDLNNDRTYNDGEQFRLLTLQKNIKVYGFQYKDKNDGSYYPFSENNNNLAITFIPPDPEVRFFTDDDLNDPAVAVILLDETNNTFKTVSVNFFGLIDVIE